MTVNGQVILDRGGLNSVLSVLGSPVAKLLNEVAVRQVVPEAKLALNNPASYTVDRRGRKQWATNNTGIPFKRSGTLQRSIVANQTTVDALGLVCFVSANVNIAPYAKNLLFGDMGRAKDPHEWKLLPKRAYYIYPDG